jgi:hypothetical protein
MGYKRNEQPVYSRQYGLDQRIDYDGGTNPIYIGLALPGTADGTAEWQIYKMAWTDGNMTHLRWSDGVDEFSKKWTLRATYNYLDI